MAAALFTAKTDSKGNKYWQSEKKNLPKIWKDDETAFYFTDVAQEISKILLRHYYDDNLSVSLKSDKSAVTIADKESNDYLHKYFSDKGYIYYGEEDKHIPDQQNWDKKKTYIIGDPLDGTTNFINRDIFAVTKVAKKYSEESGWHSSNSMIFCPTTGHCDIAVNDKGAYSSDSFGMQKLDMKARLKSFKLGDNTAKNTFFVGIFSRDIELKFDNMVNNFCRKKLSFSNRNTGVTSLDIVKGAHGMLGGILYGTPLNNWDTDAALLILKESGADVKVDNNLPVKSNSKKGSADIMVKSIVFGATKEIREDLSYTAQKIRLVHNIGAKNGSAVETYIKQVNKIVSSYKSGKEEEIIQELQELENRFRKYR